MKKLQKLVSVFLTFAMLLILAGQGSVLAAGQTAKSSVTKKSGGLYACNITFDGEKDGFFYDRNIVWDSPEVMDFRDNKVFFHKDNQAGVASIRPVGEKPFGLRADFALAGAAEGDASGVALGYGLSHAFVNVQDSSGVWFLLQNGVVQVKVSAGAFTEVPWEGSLSQETRFSLEVNGTQAKLYTVNGTQQTLVCALSGEENEVTVSGPAGETVKVLENTALPETGFVKAASYFCNSSLDNFGYDFVADEYLSLPEEGTQAQSSPAGMLEAFGVSRDGETVVDFTEGKNLTRAEAAFLTCGLIGAAREGAAGQFTDVGEASPYAGAIYALVSQNVVSGLGGGLFGPDEEILYRDLLAMLVNAFGYNQIAQVRGGYPNGYVFTARYVGISKGVALSGTDPVDAAAAVQLFVNALHADFYEPCEVTSDLLNYRCTGTVLEVLHDAKKMTGQVLEAGSCSLTTDFICSENQVNLDGRVLRAPEGTGYQSYVGMEVTAYFNAKDGESLIYLYDNQQNRTLTLDAADVLSATLDKITYEQDGQEKTVRISGAKVMVNQSRMAFPTEAALLPEAGSLTLVDSGNTGKYNVVKVLSYKTVIVGAVDTIGQVVSDKYTQEAYSFDAEGGKSVSITNAQGTQTDFGAINGGMVLLYGADESGRNVLCRISDQKVSGRVEKVRTAHVTVGGKEYRLAKSFVKAQEQNQPWAIKPAVGESYALCLSALGEVACMEKAGVSNGTVYGILTRSGSDEKVLSENKVYVELFDQFSQLKTYALAEKIKFNGVKNTPAADVLPQLAPYVNLVLKTKMAGDIITELETPVMRDNLDYSKLGEEFNMVDITKTLGTVRYKPTSLSLNFRFGLSGETQVFNMTYKADGTLDEKRTTVTKTSSMNLEQQFENSLVAYGINREGIISVLTKGPADKSQLDPTLIMVTGTSDGLNNNGEPVKCVDGIAKGKKVSYFIPEGDAETESLCQAGSIILVLINAEGEIEIRDSDNGRGKLVFDKEKIVNGPFDYYGAKNSNGDIMHSWVVKGKVFNYKGDVLMVTTAKTMEQMTPSNTYYIKMTGPMNTYQYEPEKENPFTPSSIKSIRASSQTELDGSTIMVYIDFYNVSDIFLLD